jgi:hypothetical protein
VRAASADHLVAGGDVFSWEGGVGGMFNVQQRVGYYFLERVFRIVKNVFFLSLPTSPRLKNCEHTHTRTQK